MKTTVATGVGEIKSELDEEKRAGEAVEPLILAAETSSRVGSVALALGSRLIAQSFFSAPLHHSSEMIPSIRKLLDQFGYRPCDIRQAHIASGPGSFTGLRISVTMAKIMHLAVRAQIVTVDTLDAIAANTADPSALSGMAWPDDPGSPVDRIAAVLDAKRDQFFTAVYERTGHDGPEAPRPAAEDPGYRIPAPKGGTWSKTQPDCLMTAEQIVHDFAAAQRPVYLLGDGLLYHRDAFAGEGTCILDQRLWSPSAAMVHALGCQKAQAGLFADPMALVPFYLRGPDVTLKRTC